MPGISVEFPHPDDQQLMRSARAGLTVSERHIPTIVVPAPELPPVCVATDGSVRGTFTGYGWLASSGEYGMLGFRHSTNQVGTKVVLISELRAISMAVRKLSGRDITLLSDSRLAVAMVERRMDGDDVLPPGYTTERGNGKRAGLAEAQRFIYARRDRLTLKVGEGPRG